MPQRRCAGVLLPQDALTFWWRANFATENQMVKALFQFHEYSAHPALAPCPLGVAVGHFVGAGSGREGGSNARGPVDSFASVGSGGGTLSGWERIISLLRRPTTS